MGGLSRGRDPEKLVSEAGQNKDQFVFLEIMFLIKQNKEIPVKHAQM